MRRMTDSAVKEVYTVNVRLMQNVIRLREFQVVPKRDLEDIQKILVNDLTPGGIRSIRNTVGTAKFNLKIVRGNIADTLSALDRMQKSLAPDAGGS